MQAAAPTEEPISTALKIDDLKIELGYALLPLVNSPDGSDRLTEQIKALRRSLAIEMGFVMPAVRILDNVQLEANSLRHQDQGGGRRHRPHLAGPVHGDGPDRRAGHAARRAHHGADLRPARDLDRRRAEGGGRDQGLHRGRRRDRAVDPPHRADQGQRVRADLLCGGAAS